MHTNIYLKEEEAEWIVFLHGMGGSSNIWFKQLRAFRQKYNVLLLDLPGHGESLKGLRHEIKPTLEGIGVDIWEILDTHNIKKAHFIGISLGTILLRVMASQQPLRVRSMILGGAVEDLNLFAMLLARIGNKVKALVPYMWLYQLVAKILMPRKHHKESRTAFVLEARKLGRNEFMKWFSLYTSIVPSVKQAKQKLRSKRIPCLYLMGSEDYMFLEAVKKNLDYQANEQLIVFPKCGHVINIEKSNEFNMESIKFIEQGKNTQ